MAAISAGRDHTCALTSRDGVRGWGFNSAGQLGDNSTTRRPTSVAIRSGHSNSFSLLATAHIKAGTLALSAAASRELTEMTFDSLRPPCSVSSSTLTRTGAPGNLNGVRASQRDAAPLSAGGSVAPAPQQLRLIRITAVSSTSLSSSLNPSTFGATVDFTAVVAASTSPPATGTVSFFNGAILLGTTTLDVSPSTAALTVGSYSVTASYGADAGNTTSTSTGTLTQVANKADPVILCGSPLSLSVGGTGRLSVVSTGTCTRIANQWVNGNDNAVPARTQTFSIAAPLLILDIDASAPITSY